MLSEKFKRNVASIIGFLLLIIIPFGLLNLSILKADRQAAYENQIEICECVCE